MINIYFMQSANDLKPTKQTVAKLISLHTKKASFKTIIPFVLITLAECNIFLPLLNIKHYINHKKVYKLELKTLKIMRDFL